MTSPYKCGLRGGPTRRLGESVRAGRYLIRSGNGFDLEEDVRAFRARGPVELRRERNGTLRTFDLGAEILDLSAVAGDSVRLTLAMGGEGASVRPDEVAREIFGERASRARILREDLLVDWGGKLVNPMLAAIAQVPRGDRAAG